MGWLKLFKIGIQLLLSISNIIREKQLMDAGEARGVAKSMVALQVRLGIMEEIKAETEAMSDEELDRDLRES